MSAQLATTEQQLATVATNRGVQLNSYADMKSFALDVLASGLAPKGFNTPEAVMIAMQHGMELGLSPMQALQSIAVINGRPVLWGDAALALVKAHPQFMDIIETMERGEGDDKNLARCQVMRAGQTPVTCTFSVFNAKKAGLWGKAGPWTQYPQRMLQLRARSFALRDAFPDALKGVGVAEEVRDYHEPKQAQARIVADVVLPGEEPTQIQDSPEATEEFTWEAPK